MKNLLAVGMIASAIIIASLNQVQAQTNPVQATDQVKVNVKFHEILAIAVNQGQKEINLEFKTVEDYLNGVSSDIQIDHLTVSSTRTTYAVQAKTIQPNFTAGATTMPANNVSVKADTRIATQGNSAGVIALSNNAQTIFNGTKFAMDEKIDVTYAAKGDDVTNNQAIVNEYVGKTVTAEVQYSIIVQ